MSNNIVDCFPYFNEEEILELRISLLNDVVDKFIICEANRTHSGDKKEFNCKKLIKKLGFDLNKINVLEIDFSNLDNQDNAIWKRERLQRNFAAEFICDNDICFVSDCDEIIDPNIVKYYASVAQQHPNNILRVPMVLLSGRADLRVYNKENFPMVCDSPFFCLKSHLNKYSLSEIRESKNGIEKKELDFKDICITENNIVETAGWHFSWMGDSSKKIEKYKSFMHFYDLINNSANPYSQEKTIEFIKNYEAEENNFDVLGRDNHVLKRYPTQFLPKKIFENQKIKDFLLPPRPISVVQVGTNKAYDELSDYLANKQIKFCLLVEPNIYHNESIKKCYENHKNIFIENVAVVADKIEEVELFYSTGDPDFAISSCKLDHVKYHVERYNLPGEIRKIIVPCTTLEDLLNKYCIKNLDLLLLDVEGLDAEILFNFKWHYYNIRRIEFEYLHLKEKRDEVCNMLFDMGYKKVNALQKFDWAFEK